MPQSLAFRTQVPSTRIWRETLAVPTSYQGRGLAWRLRDERAWPAALASGVFMTWHAVGHVFEALGDASHRARLLVDSLLVILPGLAALALSWPRGTSILRET